MAKAENAELVFVPLGGVGEIGMNFALSGYGPPSAREWIVIDVGVTFPDASLPGVDLVLPDTRFIEENLANLRGIIITHAHEDHYGALLDTWPKRPRRNAHRRRRSSEPNLHRRGSRNGSPRQWSQTPHAPHYRQF